MPFASSRVPSAESAAARALRRLVAASAAANADRATREDDGIRPTQLFSRNSDVDSMNVREMARLPGPVSAFKSRDFHVVPSHAPNASKPATSGLTMFFDPGKKARDAAAPATARQRSTEFFRDCLAPAELRLCVGAQVNFSRRAGDLGQKTRALCARVYCLGPRVRRKSLIKTGAPPLDPVLGDARGRSGALGGARVPHRTSHAIPRATQFPVHPRASPCTPSAPGSRGGVEGRSPRFD